MGATDPLDTEVRYVDADSEMVTTSLRQPDLGRAATALPVRRVKSHARQHHYSGRFWSATAGPSNVPALLECSSGFADHYDNGFGPTTAQPAWSGGLVEQRGRWQLTPGPR